MNEYIVDGSTVTDLASLAGAFARAVGSSTGYFGRDLQSFDDCLFGGHGLAAPCRVIWEHSATSRRNLDAAALAELCAARILAKDYLDSDGLRWLTVTEERARRGQRTLFDEVVDLIRSVTDRAPTPGWTIHLELR